MEKFDQENKIIEETKSENLVSYAERALRARIAFAGERLTIINGMILSKQDLKIKGVSPSDSIAARQEFAEGRNLLAARFSKKSNGNDIAKIASKVSRQEIRTREGYNFIQP